MIAVAAVGVGFMVIAAPLEEARGVPASTRLKWRERSEEIDEAMRQAELERAEHLAPAGWAEERTDE
jgi:hypothetical protein